MSRIDDSADRATEARLADRRAQEMQKKVRTEESSAFDRAMSSQRTGANQQARTFRQTMDPRQEAPRDAQGRAKSETGGGTQTAGTLKSQGQEQSAVLTARWGAEKQTGSVLAEAFRGASSRSEAKESQRSRERNDSEAKAEESSAKGGTAGAGRKGGRIERAGDEERGSGGSSKDQGNKDKNQDKDMSAFRMPPSALMMPPPLARPRETGAGRMSSMTKEIVDKIVSRVLVGHNSAGNAEFRIDLKTNVLKGLSIKVSAGRGKKISAVFSGSDHEALAALKGASSELKDALRARGLTLDDLVFEER